MDKKEIQSMWAAWQSVVNPASEELEEKKAKEELDPVDDKENDKKFKNRKDKDIDNDGDVDSSDEFLHKRRKAIDNRKDGGEKPANESSCDDDDTIAAGKMTDKQKQKAQKSQSQNKSFKGVRDRLEGKEECSKCDGEGCDHCDNKGYHVKESVDMNDAFETLWSAIESVVAEKKQPDANAITQKDSDDDQPMDKKMKKDHEKSDKDIEDMEDDSHDSVDKAAKGVKTKAKEPKPNVAAHEGMTFRDKIVAVLSGKTMAQIDPSELEQTLEDK